MSMTKVAHPSVSDRRAQGKGARKATPLESHTGWARPPIAGNRWNYSVRKISPGNRIWCPFRHGRMLVSPFTFYRGAAKLMAADLSETLRLA